MENRSKIAFAAVAGLLIGGLGANIDRLPVGGSEPVYVASNPDWWKNNAKVDAQKQLEAAVISFSNTVKESLPPRNEALTEHRAINQLCSDIPQPDNYTEWGINEYFTETSTKLLICLQRAEDFATAHNITYDHPFAEKAANTLRNQIN